MKRFSMLLLLTALLSALLLSGCAGGADKNGENDLPAPSSSEPETPEAGNEAGGAGILSDFTATDLEGNSVDSSIFADYDLTMVNVWATYCGPCLREMPDLGELADEYEDRGVRVVGLVIDTLNADGSINPEQVETARAIVDSTGADYLHILPSADLMGVVYQISSVPTTFFVDSEGNQVGYAYVTAMEREQFVEIIDAALAEVAA